MDHLGGRYSVWMAHERSAGLSWSTDDLDEALDCIDAINDASSYLASSFIVDTLKKVIWLEFAGPIAWTDYENPFLEEAFGSH